MPIKNIKSKGLLKNRHEPLVLAGAVAFTLLAIASWGWFWEKIFAGMLVASAGYLNWKLGYYCLCEHNIRLVEKKRVSWSEAWDEFLAGFNIHEARWVGYFILLSGSATFLITKDGDVAAIATIITTLVLLAVSIFGYTRPVPTVETPEILTGTHLQKYLETVKKQKKKFIEKRRGVRRRAAGSIAFAAGLLVFFWGISQNLAFNHQGYTNIHGILAVGMVGAVYFWVNGVTWFSMVPIFWVPFWYGLEYLLGIQLLPWGDLNSGFAQGYLPFFLALTLALETYGGFVRRKLFKVAAGDRPFFEDTAVKRQW